MNTSAAAETQPRTNGRSASAAPKGNAKGSSARGAKVARPASSSSRGSREILSSAVSEHEQIALLAYSYWEARGRQGGSPEDDWLRAEREFRSRNAGDSKVS